MKTLTNIMACELVNKLDHDMRNCKKKYRVKSIFYSLLRGIYSSKRKYMLYKDLIKKILNVKQNKRIIITTLNVLASIGPTIKDEVFPILYEKLFSESFHWGKEIHRDKVRRLLNALALLLFIDPYEYFIDKKVILTSMSYVYHHHFQWGNPSNPHIALTFPGEIVLRGNNLFFNEHVKTYHNYLINYWKPLKRKMIALFTPCSGVKPIPRSFMNVKIDGILRKYGLEGYVDRYIVSEPLALIPYRFAYYFPAAHYDYHPSMVSPEERRVYVELLRKVIEDKIARNYDRIVYSLPRFHKRIFEEAISGLDVEAVYVPYNVYYLPKLKETLLRLVRE
ncbi:MAG: hypothetical protein B6U76_04875 [Desulfurococcales archaeon ex4484_217_2]|nr:MAG: hypothetical protein B6U76_04875 [Desulfurococcales archaeon ex4484_217_2]